MHACVPREIDICLCSPRISVKCILTLGIPEGILGAGRGVSLAALPGLALFISYVLQKCNNSDSPQ